MRTILTCIHIYKSRAHATCLKKLAGVQLLTADMSGNHVHGDITVLLCLINVVVAGRLDHTGTHTLIINPVGHSRYHVRQQCCCAVNELAELVHLHMSV